MKNEKDTIVSKEKSDNETKTTMEQFVINMAQGESISTYGTAIREDIVAYTGIDNVNGIVLKKSLKKNSFL